MTLQREKCVVCFLRVCIIAILLPSCVFGPTPVRIYSPSKELISGYGLTSKVPIKMELYLSDELRAAEWQRKGSSGSYRLALGEALARNAEKVTREVFAAVVVTGGSGGPGMAGTNAVLIPRFVTAEQTAVTLTVLLEWTLKDDKGNTVWVDTIKGEGDASAWFLESAIEQRSKAMLDDLFHKSFLALSSSRAIREFAAKHEK
ncbi:MAG: hypothetical protein HOP18_13785 [Deltaproteobacteria bacterium]|nr:hypothetical protein [Deltaproteobacteria bacterium]